MIPNPASFMVFTAERANHDTRLTSRTVWHPATTDPITLDGAIHLAIDRTYSAAIAAVVIQDVERQASIFAWHWTRGIIFPRHPSIFKIPTR
jgi:hypothetical protein